MGVLILFRQSREFRVDFDLRKAIELPVTPWGYTDYPSMEKVRL